LVAKVKQVLASNRIASLPIWNTESGWGDWKDGVNSFTPESAAAIVARANILLWVSGVSRFYWYAWDNHAWVKLDLTAQDNATETPAAQAYRTVEGWMLGNRFQGCQQSANNTWTCTLTRAGHPAWIVWAPSGDTDYTPPPSWKITYGVPLSGPPLRLHDKTITIGQSPMLIY
jgi:hypothetical protein